jgi:CheY-like chemotaxis protein
MLSELLAEAGYATICCASGKEAQEVILRERPDLVITDLQMERRDAGVQVIQQMRSNPATANIPVILYSADSRSLREQAVGLSDTHCTILDKPFTIERLLATVVQLIGPPGFEEPEA